MLRSAAAGRLRFALHRLLASFEATPDDKLDFKPSETANSIRDLVVHILSGNGYVGGSLGLELAPAEGPTDRESLVARLNESTETIAKALESLSDDQVNGTVEFFGHSMPMPTFMFVDEWHYTRHTGQLDYIQTIYGDLEDHS